jgi:hypothetical protein
MKRNHKTTAARSKLYATHNANTAGSDIQTGALIYHVQMS